jgi:hypothetical protein
MVTIARTATKGVSVTVTVTTWRRHEDSRRLVGGDPDMSMTPEAEASYAIDYGLPRSELSAGAQLAYDRLLGQQVNPGKHASASTVVPVPSGQLTPPSGQLTPPSGQLPPKMGETYEERMETYSRKTMIYAHQTAIATQVIAWIIAIGVILAVILGIIAGINLAHIASQSSQGNSLP